MIEINGDHITLYIEQGKPHGPVFEITVDDVQAAKDRLVAAGAIVVKDEPDVLRVYVRDLHGIFYNLRAG
jgi:hypothetical protein